MQALKKPNIAMLTVRELFGLYSYDLPSTGRLGSAAILYGDNGSGKTTILNLVFHLLSPSPNRGHRSAIHKIPFRYFSATLEDGTVLSAARDSATDKGPCLLKIEREGQVLATWKYEPRGERSPDFENFVVYIEEGKPVVRKKQQGKLATNDGEDPYLAALKAIAPDSFALSADRQLSSDLVADPSDEVELRRLLRYDEPKSVREVVARGREIALSQALDSASKWLSRKAIEGTNVGTTNVNTVYRDIIKRLDKPTRKRSDISVPTQGDTAALLHRLRQHGTALASLHDISWQLRSQSPILLMHCRLETRDADKSSPRY